MATPWQMAQLASCLVHCVVTCLDMPLILVLDVAKSLSASISCSWWKPPHISEKELGGQLYGSYNWALALLYIPEVWWIGVAVYLFAYYSRGTQCIVNSTWLIGISCTTVPLSETYQGAFTQLTLFMFPKIRDEYWKYSRVTVSFCFFTRSSPFCHHLTMKLGWRVLRKMFTRWCLLRMWWAQQRCHGVLQVWYTTTGRWSARCVYMLLVEWGTDRLTQREREGGRGREK